ncbi:MAG: T9SS type A sorting domain-containing protein [Chitinophagales bacterium]
MKKFLLIAIAANTALAVTAQSYLSLTPNPASAVTTADYPVELAVEVINNGPESQEYLWRRTVNDIPSEWYSFVCDPNLCYGPMTSEPPLSFSITPENHKIKVTFNPNGYSGEGYIELEVFSTTDSANYNAVGVFTAELTATTAFHSPNADNTFSAYPNPANESINLMSSFSANVHAIKILNIVGKEVMYNVWQGTSGRMTMNISQLPEGIYFVQFLSPEGNIMNTKKISVKH